MENLSSFHFHICFRKKLVMSLLVSQSGVGTEQADICALQSAGLYFGDSDLQIHAAIMQGMEMSRLACLLHVPVQTLLAKMLLFCFIEPPVNECGI